MLTDNDLMHIAIEEALIAADNGEVPVGAVIVKDDIVIARAHNMVEELKSSSAHAEMLAMRQAEKRLGKWLYGCTMYVTLEPCSMCAGALVLSRMKRICIGARDPKTGACTSLYNIIQDQRLNHRLELTIGIEEEACQQILKDFFRKRRNI